MGVSSPGNLMIGEGAADVDLKWLKWSKNTLTKMDTKPILKARGCLQNSLKVSQRSSYVCRFCSSAVFSPSFFFLSPQALTTFSFFAYTGTFFSFSFVRSLGAVKKAELKVGVMLIAGVDKVCPEGHIWPFAFFNPAHGAFIQSLNTSHLKLLNCFCFVCTSG